MESPIRPMGKTVCFHNDSPVEDTVVPRQRAFTDTEGMVLNGSVNVLDHSRESTSIVGLLEDKYASLFKEQPVKHECPVSISIIPKNTSSRGSYKLATGYKSCFLVLSDHSLHFFRQRKLTFGSSLELIRSFPMVSVQNMRELQQEQEQEDNAVIVLQFEKNEVKLQFLDPTAATQAKEQFSQVYEDCTARMEVVRRPRRLSSLTDSVEFGATLTNPTYTSTHSGEVVGSQARNVIDKALISLRIRPRPVFQPMISSRDADVVPRSEKLKQLESEKAVIKYSDVDSFFMLPAECYLRLDNSYMILMWKYPTERHYSLAKYITLDQIYEVRTGQQTDAYKKFPYDTASKQSFSIIYEEQRKVINLFGTHQYTMLRSIDIVCEEPHEVKLWTEALDQCHFDTRKQLFPKKLKFPDHTLVWLKVYFSIFASACDNEISKEKTLRFIRSLQSVDHILDLPVWYVKASFYQLHDTILPGYLNWYGFVAVYDMYIEKRSTVLLDLYQQYAKQHPDIGITVGEFRDFLLTAKKWPAQKCTDQAIMKLMDRYDRNHRVYKQIKARNMSPLEMTQRLTFPGFLSFIRGKDNQIIDTGHETIYQDMDQPLTHYFINSSHNTYLSGHQIRGDSSYEAYIRPLLNGCRCLEIDCWDDGGDITVTHGNTPTSHVSFSKVLEIIKEYAFLASEYPVILSLENHCCQENRKRMAALFRATFGSGGFLVNEDLTTWQARSALPSPNALKRKVLLKDSFKYHPQDRGPSQASSTPSPTSCNPPAHLEEEQGGEQMTGYANPMSTLQHQITLPSLPHIAVEEEPLAKYKRSKRSATFHVSSVRQVTEVQSRVLHLGDRSSLQLDRSPRSTPQPSPNPQLTQQMDDLTVWRFNYLLRGTALRQYKDRLDERNDDDHVSEKEMAVELTELVLLRAQKVKSERLWQVMPDFRPSEMISFQETKAIARSRDNPQALLSFTRHSLVRIYPKGSRIKSENYDPTIFWNYGIQLVALNYQTSDVFMNINLGKFRQNGNCGYVLKPAFLRTTTVNDALPEPHWMKSSTTSVALTVKLLGGHNVGHLDSNVSTFKVWFIVFGCVEDNSCTVEYFRSGNSSSVPPLFEGQGNDVAFFECERCPEFSRDIAVPELCMFYARVEEQQTGLFGQRPSPKLYGQNTIPVDSLTQGVTFLPLRDGSGQLMHGAGLYVDISQTVLRAHPAGIQRQSRLP